MKALSVCVIVTLAVFVKGETSFCDQPRPEATCPDGWLQWQGSCYTALHAEVNYIDTSRECAKHGAAMIVPNSKDENDFLWNEIQKWTAKSSAAVELWIGCRKTNGGKLACEGEAVYHSLTFTSWGDGEPRNESGKDCIRISESFNGGWGVQDCSVKYYVACEMKLASKHRRLPPRLTHVPQMCLLNHAIKSFQVRGFEGCSLACWADAYCRSFNLLEETDGVMICQLNHANLYEAGSNELGNQENCFLYEKS